MTDRRREQLTLLLAGVVLPNAPFIALWPFGIPPRTIAIAMYAGLAIVATRMPVALVAVGYGCIVTLDVLQVVGSVTHLPIWELALSTKYVIRLKLWASPLYAGALAAIVACGITSVRLMLRRGSRESHVRVPVLVAVLLVALSDLALNISPYYYRVPVVDQERDSATRRAALGRERDAVTRTNLLFVMVEGLGELKDLRHRALLLAPFDTERIRQRYDVTTGWAPYWGSTTSAEMRELCGERGDYRRYLDGRGDHCMPARYAAAGYETTAVHTFTGEMFDRRRWYPNIGFQRMQFGEQLADRDLRWCGGVFAGVCDVDAGRVVYEQLKRGAERPEFVYWLTLNTHVPIDPGNGSGRLRCGRAEAPVQQEAVCHAVELWTDLLERVADIAGAPDLPATEILVVGDHALPLWSRAGRALFEPGRVTWVHLRPRMTGRARESAPQISSATTPAPAN